MKSRTKNPKKKANAKASTPSMDLAQALSDAQYWLFREGGVDYPDRFVATNSTYLKSAILGVYPVAEMTAFDPRLTDLFFHEFGKHSGAVTQFRIQTAMAFWASNTFMVPNAAQYDPSPFDHDACVGAVYRLAPLNRNGHGFVEFDCISYNLVTTKTGTRYPLTQRRGTFTVREHWMAENFPGWSDRFDAGLALDLTPAELADCVFNHDAFPSLTPLTSDDLVFDL